MSEFDENFEIQIKRLSLIDVSFEDDSLYTPSSPHSQSSDKNLEIEDVPLMGDVKSLQDLNDSFCCGEQVSKPMASLELDCRQKNRKHDLRQSLPWDAAFFTSEGVLEPEELFSMTGVVEKSQKNILGEIEEDLYSSSDSLFTLASDHVELENLETNLFCDLRASIEKSIIIPDVRNSNRSAGFAVMESEVSPMSNSSGTSIDRTPERQSIQHKTENPVQVTLSSKAPAKNSNVLRGSGKTKKQFLTTSGGTSSSVCKPSRLSGLVTPVSTTTTKRASGGTNKIKMEKEHAKISAGPGRRVKTPSVSTLSSRTTKQEKPMSSSVDSSRSLSSNNSSKSLQNHVKRRMDPRTTTFYLRKIDSKSTKDSPGSNPKVTSRVPSKNKINKHGSPYASSSTTKPCSNLSPASSVSEWSFESQSPTSTLNKRCNSPSSPDTIFVNVIGGCSAPGVLSDLSPITLIEIESSQKDGKDNLRQSFTWNAAFFMSAGVLEPEELSSMIEMVEKSEKDTLPRIEEVVHRSSDSLSTLASDNVELETLEADLFWNLRASIEKNS